MSNPSGGDEPFLSRWSRRKRDAATGPARDEPGSAAGVAAQAGEGEPDKCEAGTSEVGKSAVGKDAIDLAKLPKVEDLDASSDITGFLDMRVPAVLRNAALARMWTLDPTIRDFIEVAENQWNWNIPGGAPFYEEIAGNPEIAESIVQGGGSVLRAAIESSPEDSPACVPPDTLVEHNQPAEAASHSVDDVGRTDAAAQHPQATAREEADADGLTNRVEVQSEVAVCEVTAALQYPGAETDTQTVVRRRHGGALPA